MLFSGTRWRLYTDDDGVSPSRTEINAPRPGLFRNLGERVARLLYDDHA